MDSGSILLCILLLCGSAYCSGAESSYARANKIRLKNAADDGNKKAKKALSILNNFDKALASILVGNNIVNLTFSAIATVIAVDMGVSPVVSTFISTVLVLIFGEILPKNFANANSEKMAIACSPSLSTLMKLFTPITFLLIKLSDALSRLTGGGEDEKMTEEELETIIDTVEESGTLDEDQTDILQGAIEFTKTPVEDVMTMREDIVGIDIAALPEDILEIVRNSEFSRLPVYDGDIDHVIGILSVREYLRAYIRRGTVNLRRVMMKPKFAAPDAAIDDLFAEMSASRQQFLIVMKDGHTVGVATIEDFLEEIVGEIWDEYDEYDEDFIKLGGNYFEIYPGMKVVDTLHRIGYKGEIPPEIRKKTLEAWLRSNIEGEPQEEEGFTFGNLSVVAGEIENDTLTAVIIRLCENEEDAKEELEK